ncbi:MAG: alginate lyase family protein [Bacteroidetes bacterium]|nr:MAG: alginate lyase family protein [Bacteroidota bacterium]
MTARPMFFLLITFFIAVPADAQKPRTFVLNADTLAAVQERVFRGDKAYAPALKRLTKDAGKAMEQEIVAITSKTVLPPSGDAHDYYSLSRYWWPDPSKPDGLPYIRRDGDVNPEIEKVTDHVTLNQFIKTVHTLALAYYYTGNEQYAERAALWLRTWLVDPATRMSPHLRYAQMVMGRKEERGTGILDAREFSQLVDAIGILRLSRSLTPADNEAVTAWFKQYLRWLLESPNGWHERGARNNHGSWWDVQTTAIALFVGDKATAAMICDSAKVKRIGYQFQPDGSQPEELVRTLSYHYCQFNLFALTRLADLARHTGVDLWGYTTADGRSMRGGLDYLIPYAKKEKKWEHVQIKEMDFDMVSFSALKASARFGDTAYRAFFEQYYSGNRETDRIILMYGVPPVRR